MKFNVAVMDDAAAKQGSLTPSGEIVRRWARDHGLDPYRGIHKLGWWRMRIVDGTPDQQKADELQALPEVEYAVRIPLGSVCMAGYPFTVISVAFVEPAPTPSRSAASP
jgi:hypothetical protein